MRIACWFNFSETEDTQYFTTSKSLLYGPTDIFAQILRFLIITLITFAFQPHLMTSSSNIWSDECTHIQSEINTSVVSLTNEASLSLPDPSSSTCQTLPPGLCCTPLVVAPPVSHQTLSAGPEGQRSPGLFSDTCPVTKFHIFTDV